ncbi:Costars domain-containing protein [Aphelenchoides fujianensis]|nr:Costars domain-containing protein [Aphelenchoides fujianensis]
MSIQRTINKFQRIADETDEKLRKNPWSRTCKTPQYDPSAPDYGRPTPGSLTEKRGIRAGAYIMNEVVRLCEVIVRYGEGPMDARRITFGDLFRIYETISTCAVGYLIRARKYKLLTFKGEMLYQGQDDHKTIQMLMSIRDIHQLVHFSNDPVACVQIEER